MLLTVWLISCPIRKAVTLMPEARYCDLCGCICVACVQIVDGCESCELKHPELLDYEDPFTEALLDHFDL